jgi:hypothetical protein
MWLVWFTSDCCDGSDEWNSVTKCENTCQVSGQAYRKQLQEKLDKLQKVFNVLHRVRTLSRFIGECEIIAWLEI